MKRNTALKILNPLLGLLMLNQVSTALLHDLLPRQVFHVLHKQGGLVLAAVAALHLILNWNWIRANFGRARSASASREVR
jgi:hypothetical protein